MYNIINLNAYVKMTLIGCSVNVFFVIDSRSDTIRQNTAIADALVDKTLYCFKTLE